MCLIIYSKHGEEIPRDHFWQGSLDNNDGIGIMSIDGVEKFLGRKKTKRAYAYARSLSNAGIPYAVHFRWATHGKIGQFNTHPFEIPGTPYYMMHNGVLWTSSLATDDLSDTAIFARDVMPLYVDWRDSSDPDGWLMTLEKEAAYNRLVLLNTESGEFDIVNESLGDWLNGCWYSNLYSVPKRHRPKAANRILSATSLSRSIIDATARHAMPMPAGPTMHAEDDADRLEEWYYKQRAKELSGELPGWGDYPLPGSWEDRHALAEDRPDVYDDRDAADPMDGVQQYV